jgi:hypothetical protein
LTDRPDAERLETFDELVRGPQGQRKVQQRSRRRWPAPDAARLVYENANPLVARPSEPEPIGFGADAPAGLRDRMGTIVQANDGLDQPVRNSRRKRDHAGKGGRKIDTGP